MGEEGRKGMWEEEEERRKKLWEDGDEVEEGQKHGDLEAMSKVTGNRPRTRLHVGVVRRRFPATFSRFRSCALFKGRSKGRKDYVGVDVGVGVNLI